jgi:hypothetical protein
MEVIPTRADTEIFTVPCHKGSGGLAHKALWQNAQVPGGRMKVDISEVQKRCGVTLK